MKLIQVSSSIFAAIFALGIVTSAPAQCDPPKSDSLRIIHDVKFTACRNVHGIMQTLSYDSYEPVTPCVAKKPVVIFLHSGAFHGGDKADTGVVRICKGLAKKGFLCIAPNYRLGLGFPSRKRWIKAGYRALDDVEELVRFVKYNAAELGADSSLIFAGGLSAGGYLAIHCAKDAASGNRRPVESDRSNPIPQQISADIVGVINCWGGIFDTTSLGMVRIPMISFRGSRDLVMPETRGWACMDPFLRVFGPKLITKVIASHGIYAIYRTLDGARHGLEARSAQMDTLITDVGNFLDTSMQISRVAATIHDTGSTEESAFLSHNRQ